ncbi:MAG: hypothetical protein AAF675_05850 [Pseudomonadota bacterium]
MMGRVLVFAAPLLALLAPALSSTEAAASAAEYGACSQGASTSRALRACNTFRTEIRECQQRRDGGGVQGPNICLDGRLEAWRAVLQAEEARASQAGVAEGDFETWETETRGYCWDEQEIRLSTERFGAPFAEFEAMQCELRSIIRRTLATTKALKGL